MVETAMRTRKWEERDVVGFLWWHLATGGHCCHPDGEGGDHDRDGDREMNRGGRFKGCLEAGFGTRWRLNMVWWWWWGER